jgi:hypothetical protein
MGVVTYSMRDASDIRRRQQQAATAEFQDAWVKASRRAQMRYRSANLQWELARTRAHETALARVREWRKYQHVDDVKIQDELLRHERRLTAEYLAVVPLTLTQQDAERWYARLIRSELRRRDGESWTCQVPGCGHGHRVPVRDVEVAS